MHERRRSFPSESRFILTCVAAALCLVLSVAGAHGQLSQQVRRQLSGTVTDQSHKPIRGAIVQLQDPADNAVTTYITDLTGHYVFKRLNSEADYIVWVEVNGDRSHTRSISKFDDHLDKIINFTVKTR